MTPAPAAAARNTRTAACGCGKTSKEQSICLFVLVHFAHGVVMDERQSEELHGQLEDLNCRLAQFTYEDLTAKQDVHEQLNRMVECMGDIGILKEKGYLTLGEACTKICDLYQAGQLPRIRSFSHCGKEIPYHVLQTYVVCPHCRSYRMKTGRFFGGDEVEDVAAMALHWLQVKSKTIPDWNQACDETGEG